jgi:hypothetical protein
VGARFLAVPDGDLAGVEAWGVAAGAWADVTTASGASLGLWPGLVAQPTNIADAIKNSGATKRLPVNPTVNSHPHGEAQEDRFAGR